MGVQDLIPTLGPEIEDADEEVFSLFTKPIPSQNLGFVDPHSSEVQISVHTHDFVIQQSPSVLSSSRKGGTTGAVLWKITPLISTWLATTSNVLWEYDILTAQSTVVEVGCGISGLIALSLAPMVAQIILTDQEYVGRLVKANIENNWREACRHGPGQVASGGLRKEQRGKVKQLSSKQKATPSKGTGVQASIGDSNTFFMSLDWETDSPGLLKQSISPPSSRQATEEDPGFDLVIACDTIYNDALIQPFLNTCAELCQLRPTLNQEITDGRAPTVCLVAQQLRSPEIFASWLMTALRQFRVWQVDLGQDSEGYVLHLLVLRDENERS